MGHRWVFLMGAFFIVEGRAWKRLECRGWCNGMCTVSVLQGRIQGHWHPSRDFAKNNRNRAPPPLPLSAVGRGWPIGPPDGKPHRPPGPGPWKRGIGSEHRNPENAVCSQRHRIVEVKIGSYNEDIRLGRILSNVLRRKMIEGPQLTRSSPLKFMFSFPLFCVFCFF